MGHDWPCEDSEVLCSHLAQAAVHGALGRCGAGMRTKQAAPEPQPVLPVSGVSSGGDAQSSLPPCYLRWVCGSGHVYFRFSGEARARILLTRSLFGTPSLPASWQLEGDCTGQRAPAFLDGCRCPGAGSVLRTEACLLLGDPFP